MHASIEYMIILGVVLGAAAFSVAPAPAQLLQGEVNKAGGRIQRPEPATIAPIKSSVESSDFNLSGQADLPMQQPRPASPITLPQQSSPVEIRAIDAHSIEKPKPEPANDTALGAKQPGLLEGVNHTRGKHSVIVRFLAFEDHGPDVTPYINYDGLRMAQALLDNGNDVTMLMDRHGVRLARTGYMDFGIYHEPISFVKLIKKFLRDGGKVCCNKYYCDLYSIQQRDLLPGVAVVSEKEMADLIMDADKMLDYDGH